LVFINWMFWMKGYFENVGLLAFWGVF